MLRLISLFLISLLLLCGNIFAETTAYNHNGRSFKLVNPSNSVEKKPLLLLLHGCKQSADIILDGTGLATEAMKRNFFILVPEQTQGMNPDRCWNWFYSREQLRGGFNEMITLISAIENLSQKYPIDRTRVFVAGLSAGGAMAHNLLACYPDYFAGVAVHSGLAFKTAENIYEAQAVLTANTQKTPEYLGTKAFLCGQFAGRASTLKKILIIHGIQDPRVLLLHAELISSTHEVISDLLDDAVINHSDSPVITENSENFEYGYKAFITDKKYKAFSERKILIQGLKHAWGGGPMISENFDPKAPSSNAFILNYFNL